MPIIYDLETDIRFLQGIEQGIEEQTRKQEEANKSKIIEMLKVGRLSIEEIADYRDVSVEYINELKEQLEKD